MDDELKVLEEKSKKLITESERLRQEQDALLKQIVELTDEVRSIRAKSRMHESN